MGSKVVFDWAWQGSPVAIGYEVQGHGTTTAVLLPAFSTVSSRDEMRPLAERLGPRFQTITPDWPGFGLGRHKRLDHTPDLHLAFLRAFMERIVGQPAVVAAAGHAAGYVLTLARQSPDLFTRIALIAPTWRGPFPTMMRGYRPVQDRIRTALRLPGIGHALYRLNVLEPVIAMMYRRHVYGDPGRITPTFVAAKAAVARRPGGRFGSAAFVTGGLDIVRDREAFLRLAVPALVVYGAQTPAKSREDMEALASQPGIASHRFSFGSLGVHEEHAGPVADILRPFLLSAA